MNVLFFITNREKDPTYSTFTCITKHKPQLQNQYLNVLFFITNREKGRVESQCSNISLLHLNTHQKISIWGRDPQFKKPCLKPRVNKISAKTMDFFRKILLCKDYLYLEKSV